MNIMFDGIVLRDYRLSDIEDEIRWTNTDTAWFYADTPWMEMEPVDPDALRRDMTVLAVVAGWNYTFGRNAAGSAETLRADGNRCGYGVLIEDAKMLDGKPVSSSRVREALGQGDIEAVNELLLVPYTVTGTVLRDGREKTGSGVLCLQAGKRKMLPAPGEYTCIVKVRDEYGLGTVYTGPWEDRILRLRLQYPCPPAAAGEKIRLTLTGKAPGELKNGKDGHK